MANVPQSKTVALAELTRAEREVGEIVAFGDEFYRVEEIDLVAGLARLDRVAYVEERTCKSV